VGPILLTCTARSKYIRIAALAKLVLMVALGLGVFNGAGGRGFDVCTVKPAVCVCADPVDWRVRAGC